MKKEKKRIIAAFDFDGTLSKRDSLTPFIFFVHGIPRSLFYLCTLLPQLLAFCFYLLPRQTTKEAILRRCFSHIPLSTLKKKGEQYARQRLPQLLKPEALAKLSWHRKQKHKLILISASVSIYLGPWAKQMGFDHFICSELAHNGEKITGKLQEKNCRNAEKVRRLAELLGPREEYTLYAYGDSDGDKELLAYADYPFFKKFNNEK